VTFSRAQANYLTTYVGADGLIKYASADEPRFDHNPLTGECLGLLVEEQRTNEITQSEAFNTWAGGSTLITSNIAGIVSPDGTSGNVDLWNGNNFFRSFSSSSTNRIISVYVKFTGNVGQFRIGSYGGNTTYTNFTISSTGVITANTPSVGTSISVGNGWYRVYMNIGTGNEHIIENVSGTPSLYLWGAQSEAGTFPTSYIPTSGSTVTRSADTASITGTNFTSFYNQSEGTWFVDFANDSVKQTSSFEGVLSLDTNTPRIMGSSINGFGGNTSISPVSARQKTALAYGTTEGRSFNGTISSGSGGTVSSRTLVRIGTGAVTAPDYELSTTINRLTYYPTRLQNFQLQQLTK
jgi:hypothetical protein